MSTDCNYKTTAIYTTSMPTNMSMDDVYSDWKYHTTDFMNSTVDPNQRANIEVLTSIGEIAFQRALGVTEENSSLESRFEELQGQFFDLEILFMTEKNKRKSVECQLKELQDNLKKNGEVNLAHTIEVGNGCVNYLSFMDKIITNMSSLISSDKDTRSLLSVIEHLKTVDRLGRAVSKNWDNTDICKSLKKAIDDLTHMFPFIDDLAKNVTDATSALAMPMHPNLTADQISIAKQTIMKKLKDSSLANLKVDAKIIIETIGSQTP